MKIEPLQHNGLPREDRTFGIVKAGKRPVYKRKPSSLFYEGLRPMAEAFLSPGEVPNSDWGLIIHEAPWRNPKSNITGLRVPLMVEISPLGTRYREALAPGERTHLAGGPRAHLQNLVCSADEVFASGIYHGIGGVLVVLDELYQYDDIVLSGEPFAERYGLLRQLIAELSERNPDPLTLKVAAAALHTGAAMAGLLATAPRPGELRYLVALNGSLEDPRARLLLAQDAMLPSDA